LAQRLGFDLADALAGDAELLTDFLERPLVPVLQAEAQDSTLRSRSVRFLRTSCIFSLSSMTDAASAGATAFLIFDEVAQMRVFFFADRGFERDRLL